MLKRAKKREYLMVDFRCWKSRNGRVVWEDLAVVGSDPYRIRPSGFSVMQPTPGQTRFMVRIDWIKYSEKGTPIAYAELTHYLPFPRRGENLGDYRPTDAKAAA